MKTKQCAKFIKENNEKIISLWEKEAVKKIEAASKTDNLVLRNHLPVFLDQLAQNLLKNEFFGIERKFDTVTSKEHGRSRASTNHYDVMQVGLEYSLLREILFSELKNQKILDLASAERITKIFEKTTLFSIHEFTSSIRSMQEKVMGTVAHDIRNPLSTAFSAVDAMENNLIDQEEGVGIVQGNLVRAIKLLENLLDTTSIQAGGGMKFKFNRANLDEELSLVFDEAKQIYKNNIIYEKDSDDMHGIFDTISIRRAVENLISNAIKYGGISSPITISAKSKKKYIEISIKNKGSFIERSQRDSLFDFSTRAGDANSSHHKSWGVGLCLVKTVSDAHKGEVKIKSDEELGTVFTMKLPRNSRSEGEEFSQPLST